ncbi:hypothetical protein M885DRAFT_518171 [Pelagophyceae sp. CCMP2097]|nr:hypothetical protein M885DRAFT_518171 [Pelagophyceae sp. CCMP2097]
MASTPSADAALGLGPVSWRLAPEDHLFVHKSTSGKACPPCQRAWSRGLAQLEDEAAARAAEVAQKLEGRRRSTRLRTPQAEAHAHSTSRTKPVVKKRRSVVDLLNRTYRGDRRWTPVVWEPRHPSSKPQDDASGSESHDDESRSEPQDDASLLGVNSTARSFAVDSIGRRARQHRRRPRRHAHQRRTRHVRTRGLRFRRG